MNTIISFFRDYVAWLTIPDFTITDVLEIAIIAFAFYHIILWIKDTRAWVLLKGMVILGIIFLVALVLEMNVVLWVFQNAMVVGIMALVVIFQPELRNALEQLGRKKILSSLTFDNQKSKNERYSAESIEAVIKAVYDNTPLHDGAVILRDNRIVSATCYLPLSNNLAVSKELGTRHRAGLGISEVSDSLTIIVSEETGFVSLACDGKLYRKVDADTLMIRLQEAAKRNPDEGKMKWWKGRKKDEKETDQ